MNTNLLPFRQGTRQKIAKVGNALYNLGQTSTLRLPNVGFLSKIYYRFSGTFTVDAGDFTPAILSGNHDVPYRFIPRILVQLNSGRQILVNTSAWDLFLLNRAHNNFSPAYGFGNTSNTTNYQFFLESSTTGYIRFTQEIPIAISSGLNFEIGLINLQAPELEATVEFTAPPSGNAIAPPVVFTSVNGLIEVFYEYYEVPDPSKYLLPQPILHKILTTRYPIQNTGDNEFEIPRGGKLLRLISSLRVENNLYDDWERVRLNINNTYDVYDHTNWLNKWLIYTKTRADLNPASATQQDRVFGEIVLDFYNSFENRKDNDFRDIIDTEAVTSVKKIITLPTSAPISGTSGDFVTITRQLIQEPVVSWGA